MADYPAQEEFIRGSKESSDPNEPLRWRSLPGKDGVDALGFLENKGPYEKWAHRKYGTWEPVYYTPRKDGDEWSDRFGMVLGTDAASWYTHCRFLDKGSVPATAEQPATESEKLVKVDGLRIGLSHVLKEPYTRPGVDEEGRPVTEHGIRQREHWIVEMNGEPNDYFREADLPRAPAKPGSWYDYRQRPVSGNTKKALEIARPRWLKRYHNLRKRAFPDFEVTSDHIPRAA